MTRRGAGPSDDQETQADEGTPPIRTDGGQQYCIGCGERIEALSETCPHCGTVQSGEDRTEGEPTPVESSPPPQSGNTVTTETAVESVGPNTGPKTTADSVPDDSGTTEGTGETTAEAESASKTDNTETSRTPGVGEEYCSICGKIVSKDAAYCPHCRTDRDTANGRGNSKRPILAGLLSLVLIGSGQVYNGQLQRGVQFFGTAFVVLLLVTALGLGGIGALLLLAVWGYAGYDAYSYAKGI